MVWKVDGEALRRRGVRVCLARRMGEDGRDLMWRGLHSVIARVEKAVESGFTCPT